MNRNKPIEKAQTIALTQGKVALVDDADYPELSRYRWRARLQYKVWYAVRHATPDEVAAGETGNRTMHRQLMGFPVGFTVDHRDRDGLNNQRHNLRLATHAQQMQNSRTRPHGGWRGVRRHWDRWTARIRQSGVETHLGCFGSSADAARAYDAAAVKAFGEFAVLNFPKGGAS